MSESEKEKVKQASVLTPDQIRTMLDQDRVARSQAANREINAILQKYNCRMETSVSFGSPDGVRMVITIVANQEPL